MVENKLEDLCTFLDDCAKSGYGNYPICKDGMYKQCPTYEMLYANASKDYKLEEDINWNEYDKWLDLEVPNDC